MTKQELVRDIKQTFNGAGLITAKQVAQYRGVHPNTAAQFLQGLDSTQEGGGHKKYYFVGDVADRILKGRQLS